MVFKGLTAALLAALLLAAVVVVAQEDPCPEEGYDPETACTECLPTRWGPTCNRECACGPFGICAPDTGSCSCPGPDDYFNGVTCIRPQDLPHMYGGVAFSIVMFLIGLTGMGYIVLHPRRDPRAFHHGFRQPREYLFDPVRGLSQ